MLADGDVVRLEGDLGAGKTAFARALIRKLAESDITVPSPTFTLLQTYDLPGLKVTHADLYRLGGPAEVVELGLEEAWETGVLLVEWSDRANGLLPEDGLTVRLELAEGDARRVELIATGRLEALLDRIAAT